MQSSCLDTTLVTTASILYHSPMIQLRSRPLTCLLLQASHPNRLCPAQHWQLLYSLYLNPLLPDRCLCCLLMPFLIVQTQSLSTSLSVEFLCQRKNTCCNNLHRAQQAHEPHWRSCTLTFAPAGQTLRLSCRRAPSSAILLHRTLAALASSNTTPPLLRNTQQAVAIFLTHAVCLLEARKPPCPRLVLRLCCRGADPPPPVTPVIVLMSHDSPVHQL